MELQVLTSKKGTKVVTATALYQALQLPEHHYATDVRKWLHEVYEFRDGIRRPESHKDYAPRPAQEQTPLLKDYYLSVELAKLMALASRSKVKLKCAKYLQAFDDQVENAELLAREDVLNMLELVKAMGMVSYQEQWEQKHREVWERQAGVGAHWWAYRAKLLGYTTEQLRERAKQMGKPSAGKSARQLLMLTDKYEMVRAGVIDLFMAMGKGEQYARNMGDLAKSLATQLRIDLFDDRGSAHSIFPTALTATHPAGLGEMGVRRA